MPFPPLFLAYSVPLVPTCTLVFLAPSLSLSHFVLCLSVCTVHAWDDWWVTNCQWDEHSGGGPQSAQSTRVGDQPQHVHVPVNQELGAWIDVHMNLIPMQLPLHCEQEPHAECGQPSLLAHPLGSPHVAYWCKHDTVYVCVCINCVHVHRLYTMYF